jgi:regulation of enolase protein 1 (concanavalin A-like superfamily)
MNSQFVKGSMKKLQWQNEPSGDGSFELNQDGVMVLRPPSKRDFWQRTFYTPLLVKDDGPSFLQSHLGCDRVCVKVSVEISRSPGAQFDQAGLMVRLDSLHWIKTGIEVVDDIPRLSCVVTNEYSDWSTQKWNSLSLTIRVSQMGDSSYVVEAQTDDMEWMFIRVCHLRGASGALNVGLGIFGCCPVKQNGCSIEFKDFSFGNVEFKHNADENY